MATKAQLQQDLINAVAKIRVSNQGAPMDVKFSDGKTYTVYSDGSGAGDQLGIDFRGLSDQFNSAESALRPAPAQQPQQTQQQTQQSSPLSQAASKSLALQNANAAFFPNLDSNGMPILNRSTIDAELNRLKTNDLNANNSNIRDAIYGSGWNAKSDAVQVLNGAAVYGIAKPINAGIMGTPMYQKINGASVTDQDFINAAKSAGIDPNAYYKTQPGNMGVPTKTLDRNSLYNAINDKGKDLYSITNTLQSAARGDTAPHATILFKADGDQLKALYSPQDNQPAVSYFNTTRYASDPGIFADLAPFLMLAPAIGGIIGAGGGLLGEAGSGWAAANEAAGLGTAAAGTLAPDVAALIEGGGFLNGGYGSIGPSGYTAGPLISSDEIAAAQAALEKASNTFGVSAADLPGMNQAAEAAGIGGGLGTGLGLSSALKTAKSLFGAGKAVTDLLGGTPTTPGGSGGSGGSGGGSNLPTFLDSTPEFLNKMKPIGPYGGLKTVNKEAEKEISPLDSEPIVSAPTEQPTMSTFKIGGLASGGGEFSQLIKDMTPCEKATQSTFSKICDRPEFLFSSKSKTYNPLKQLRQTKVNPLASGGLPHKYAAAAPKGHKPEFITGMTGYYACGKGTGQSDDIAAMLHDGDYVMDAETVSALGDGSSKAGREVLESFREKIPHKKEGGSNPVPAKIADGEYVFPAAFVTALGGGDNKRGAEILDGLRTKLRAHKRGAPLDKIPPKAKDPIEYIKTRSK